ncbi:MAG: HIT family protein [Candidatus Micrarchaeia archaeon]
MKDVFCNKKVLIKQAYYESKYIYILYNIRPILPGHSLIIPKRHVEFIQDLKEDEWLDILHAVKKILPILMSKYKADSYNLTSNIGPYSGREINHVHIHVIPRKKDDLYSKNVDMLYAGIEKDLYPVDKDVDPAKETKELRKIFKYGLDERGNKNCKKR